MKYIKITLTALLLLGADYIAKAVEVAAPATVYGYVGAGGTPGVPNGFKSETFLLPDTFFAVTNYGGSGAATVTIVTNDFGLTNLNTLKHVVPGSGFVSGATYVTNAFISPFLWVKDGAAAAFQQFTAKPSWADAPTWCNANGDVATNVVLTVACNGHTSVTTNINILIFAKSGDGQYYDTNSAQIWSVPIGPLTGTNLFVTNAIPPATFLQGARHIRLAQVNVGTNATASTNYFSAISLNGYGR